MTIFVTLNVASLIASIISIYANVRLIKILKNSRDSSQSGIDEASNPETYLAERLRELQTMKFSDMTRRIK